MVIVEGGDHFFEGHLPEMQAAIHAWVSRLFRSRAVRRKPANVNCPQHALRGA